MNIIEIHNLSKKYIIGHDKAASGMYKYSSLRDSIAHTCRGIVQRIRHPLSPNAETTALEEFWALKDINLEIEQGDKVGIIGRNGAGKSTLLKILSRITEPTSGKFTIKGRIASLLEVGTGFHPELSGRENIYLNGAVLGMTRKEIKKKFDEIVDFSGVEKFLDTPVKRFSSGMYVRLAFAVAAHLDPEILLIDEVLAVGDAEFQKKCLGKMDEVSKQGRTILFVSHNMGTIMQFCSTAIVLNQGSIKFNGHPDKAIDHYLDNSSNESQIVKKTLNNKNSPQFLSIYNCDNEGNYKIDFKHNEPIFLLTEIYLPSIPTVEEFALSLYDKNRRRIFTIHEPILKYYRNNNIIKLLTNIPEIFLTPGRYSWLMCINVPSRCFYDLQDSICKFSIVDAGSSFVRYENADYGCVFVKYSIKSF